MENSFTPTQNNKHDVILIEVFKTDIKNPEQANFLKSEVLEVFHDLKIDFDLEDCDSILRVEGYFEYHKLIEIAKKSNIKIEVLND